MHHHPCYQLDLIPIKYKPDIHRWPLSSIPQTIYAHYHHKHHDIPPYYYEISYHIILLRQLLHRYSNPFTTIIRTYTLSSSKIDPLSTSPIQSQYSSRSLLTTPSFHHSVYPTFQTICLVHAKHYTRFQL